MSKISEIQLAEAKQKFDRRDCVFVDKSDPASYRRGFEAWRHLDEHEAG